MELNIENFQEHLDEQLEFIERSAISYDSGFKDEIKRLAVAVRILVHDTNRSTSLLKLCGRKDIDYVDTAVPFDEYSIISHSSLMQMGYRGDAPASEISPFLDDSPFHRKVDFDLWWNGIVFVDKNKNEFSRKDIVLTLANKEGGAHVDKQLDAEYAALRKDNSLGWCDVDTSGKVTPLEDPVPATMRQIAHEILKTLKSGYVCAKKNTNLAGLMICGASLVEGNKASTIPANNLPKNRPRISGVKLGRNDPCPCGSGKKHKKCCC